ncbi:dUTP diphosphatase [Gudongella oleilytica]|jgi:dUTP pyrophosphatase|uniref:dUTP diphosphatase n=1 Tax=Gudongella oleilytica TaxID=1582259 RepID=UPI000EDEDD45|nr:dUTP diphosphatase [Gudongella oleilytica]MDY0255800.1 dUTP diphosphatase [Gudongella oleilytica]HCO19028.1 dUTP diphosphatase [Tissierellales bacterium]HMM68936.1 dUTP diphosphatase [Gudongella oleilytica]
MNVRIVNKGSLRLPEYKTPGASGVDLMANLNEPVILKPLERYLVPTGLFAEIPEGYEAQIRGRSGLAINNGISLANGIGTIDSDYRGEIKVILINLGTEPFEIKHGDRIAQMVLCKYEKIDFELVEELNDTERGKNGFGHTGL